MKRTILAALIMALVSAPALALADTGPTTSSLSTSGMGGAGGAGGAGGGGSGGSDGSKGGCSAAASSTRDSAAFFLGLGLFFAIPIVRRRAQR